MHWNLFHQDPDENRGLPRYHSSVLVPFCANYEEAMKTLIAAFNVPELTELHKSSAPGMISLKCGIKKPDGEMYAWAKVSPEHWERVITPADDISVFVKARLPGGDQPQERLWRHRRDSINRPKLVSLRCEGVEEGLVIPTPATYGMLRLNAWEVFVKHKDKAVEDVRLLVHTFDQGQDHGVWSNFSDSSSVAASISGIQPSLVSKNYGKFFITRGRYFIIPVQTLPQHLSKAKTAASMATKSERSLVSLFVLQDVGSYDYDSSALVPFSFDYEVVLSSASHRLGREEIYRTYMQQHRGVLPGRALFLKCRVRNGNGEDIWAVVGSTDWSSIVTPNDEIGIFWHQAPGKPKADPQPEAQDGKSETKSDTKVKFVSLADHLGNKSVLIALSKTFEEVNKAVETHRMSWLQGTYLTARVENGEGGLVWPAVGAEFYDDAVKTSQEEILHLRVMPRW
ncbi:unnamed protein product [Cyclocybe aegerita]|uniref:Uncharacterized protein n=1 Tax=Cyclocybe aegerita TaxID=1973307 RepID=A0A8S0W0X6_CYCAE|nr:unnamed protein product [Cyclocybe aegerita]